MLDRAQRAGLSPTARRDAAARRSAGCPVRAPARSHGAARRRPAAGACNRAGSMPRPIETSRIASAIWALRTRWMPSAACSSAEAERTRDRRFDRLAREVRRELERTGREIIRIDVAQDDRGIGHRRPLAAAAVAGGTGLRARRLGPDPQRAGAIDPGDRPAARTDRVHIDHRHAHRIAADLAFGADQRLPAADQGDVAARPADIDGDQVFDPGRAADLQATDDAGRGARQEEPHRTLPGDAWRS